MLNILSLFPGMNFYFRSLHFCLFLERRQASVSWCIMEIRFLVFLMFLSDLVYFFAFVIFFFNLSKWSELVMLLGWKSLDLTLESGIT